MSEYPRLTPPTLITGLIESDLEFVMASLRHFVVFALFGVLFSEFMVLRRGIDAATAARVAPLDI
jgi:uncharacterized membrane protein